MKRIAVISNNERNLPYGMGTYMANLIECLRCTSFAFDIVCLNADVYELRIVEKVGYREILIPGFAGSTDKKKIAYCRMLPYLLKELFNDDDEIIFHFNHFILNYFSDSLKSMFSCKIILTVHYTGWGILLNGDYRKLKMLSIKAQKGNELTLKEKQTMEVVRTNRDVFRKTDIVLFIAQHTVKACQRISLLRDTNFAIVHNGLKDTYKKISIAQREAIRKRYNINEHETILFFAGWLGENKGIYELIEAVKKVLRTHPYVHLFIAGEGNFPELLNKSRSACTQITFLGLLDKTEVYDFYRIAHLGIVCSIYEEFGLTALEMMMHQLPVVATDTGGLSEIIDDGITGLKVPLVYRKGQRTVDIDRLAEKIIFLTDNPPECLRLGKNARKKFLSKYELSVFTAKMIQVYNSI